MFVNDINKWNSEEVTVIKIVEAKEVYEKLDVQTCMDLMKEALVGLEKETMLQPLRSVHKLPHENKFGFMPAYLGDEDCFGAKVITAFHKNAGTKYPSHMGYVMVFESQHGSLVGMVDAGTITELRTGAVSGVATDVLARKDAKSLAMIGAGAQARSHWNAISAVRNIEEVYVYDLDSKRAEQFIQDMNFGNGVKAVVCDTIEQTVKDADIICTLTPSSTPFLERYMVKAGTHINAVGAFTPNTREVSSDLVAASKLYADYQESMEKECGEYLIPLGEGVITRAHIVGSIGEILLERCPGRETDDEITLFDGLGLAVEDVICARYMLSCI